MVVPVGENKCRQVKGFPERYGALFARPQYAKLTAAECDGAHGCGRTKDATSNSRIGLPSATQEQLLSGRLGATVASERVLIACREFREHWSPMMDVLLQLLGSLLAVTVLLDVFFTVLFPASGHGPIRKPIAYFVWLLFRLVGTVLTGQRRRNFLSYTGPVLIGLTLIVWFLMLAAGFAMVFKPALGTDIEASSGATDTGWATAFYFSGFNLTTLGVGDISPKTGLYRILTVTEAAIGFGFFSMVITYFLSVYSNLTSRNAFAQGLHLLTGGTGDAAELLARLANGPDLSAVQLHLSETAKFVRQIHQTHRFYPVLRHFHYREPYYALPRILLTALDTVSLMRTAIDRERYDREIRWPELDELYESALTLLHGLTPAGGKNRPVSDDVLGWTSRYENALARLSGKGVRIRPDASAGARDYTAVRAEWHEGVRQLARIMLYQWDDIESRMPG